MLAIILPAILAGIVAILVTLAIERFGGLVGGVLGTIPSTIIPAAAGVYHIDGKEGLLSSMSIVPLAMMVNGIMNFMVVLLDEGCLEVKFIFVKACIKTHQTYKF